MSFRSQESRSLFRLTLPILATQLAQVGMGTVDTLMSGHISTEDLAAVAIGTSLWMPVWLFASGVLVAISPLASVLNASGQHRDMPKLLAAGIFSGVLLGLLALLVLMAGSLVLESHIADEKTAFVAANYTRAIALGMPAAGVFLALRLYAEAVGQPFHVTRIMLLGLALNVPANGLFLYGWFGLPELGGIGCGIGSSLIFVGMAIALARNTRKHRLPADFPLWREAVRPLFAHVRDIFKIGVPIGVAIFFEVSLFVVIALFLADLGPTIVAGHQVALNLSSLTFMVPLSIGMALTVRVSFWQGKSEPILAMQTAWLGVQINFGLALFNACLMVLFARTLTGFYSPDSQVVDMASGLLLFAALFQLSDAVQVGAAGALRAYHDTFAVMLITCFAYWLVGLGSGYYLAFLLPEPWGAQGFWTGLILGLTVAAVLLTLRLRYISRKAVQS